ncbi:MAG: DNA replication complex subunit Gins51 [Candidatus Kariarchaeaceae archaeon]
MVEEKRIYDVLIKLWKQEVASEAFEELDSSFWARVRDFLSHIESMSSSSNDDLLKDLYLERLNRVRFMINDVVRIRTDKILYAAKTVESVPSGLSIEEQDLFEAIKQSIDLHRRSIYSVTTASTSGSPFFDKKLCIRILDPEPEQMIGSDLQAYGPFDKEDVTFLPLENAKLLIRLGKAEEIKINF